ncbi:DELLA protein GAI1 [Linum grandiflorum]
MSSHTAWETTDDNNEPLLVEDLDALLQHHWLTILPDDHHPQPCFVDDHHSLELQPAQQQPLFSSSSLELLRSSVKKSLIRNQTTATGHDHDQTPDHDHDQEPSLPEIIRIAAASFIKSSSRPPGDDDDEPLFDLNFSYSEGLTKKVQHVQYLMRAAENVCCHKYEQAISLLEVCDSLSSRTGNLTERVVYYFAHALRERVYSESGVKISSLVEEFEKLNVEEALTAPSPILGVIYAKIPFYQVGQLAGVQAIVESVERAKRIHIIDLRIRNGMQWTALIQALASRRKRAPEMLKITAIVTSTANSFVHETGERLAKFAESMQIPFAFRTVTVHNMFELDKNMFDLDPRDAVAIFSEYALHDLILNPTQLEAFMFVMRDIRPTVMVVIEIEAELNGLNFGHRFVEALFHYGAYFDCVDSCLGGDNKLVMESMFLSEQVNAVLVKEMKRTATVEVWRKFFGRFWMVEDSLSPTTMETVNLLLCRFSGGRCCTVDLDGRSLVVGWKGTPIFSLSTWNFLLAKPSSSTDQ